MTHDKDTSQRKAKQEKPVIRRDKVVVTKVTEQELAQIKSSAGQCGMTRSDFIANALHGLTDNEKIKLFRHQPTMLDWYEKVAYVTDRVTDFLQSAQTVNSYPAGTTNEEVKEEDA